MKLYDMHSHILPKVDDGAKSSQESLLLVEALKKQGINDIAFTPHFYSDEYSLQKFIGRRQRSVERAMPILPDDVNYCLASEVFVTPYLFSESDLSPLCYGGGKYMLTEFSYSTDFKGEELEFIYRLLNNYEIIPVIAHIERYPCLMQDKKILNNLHSMGILFQVNVGSFNKFFIRKKLIKLINSGYVDLLGSDTHSFTKNDPMQYKKTVAILKEKAYSTFLDDVAKNAQLIFDDATMLKKV